MSKINKQIYDAIAISDASFTFGLSAVIVLGVMATLMVSRYISSKIVKCKGNEK